MTLHRVGLYNQCRVLCSAVTYRFTHSAASTVSGITLELSIMAIVQTLSKSSFINAFKQSSRKDQFSYEALEVIFDYLEEYSDRTDEPVELDIVAICCDFAESSLSELASSYEIDLEGLEGEDRLETVLSYMEKNTFVLGMVDDETMVYVQF